ncbi:hypothetical protein CRG98_002711 [Punica granatum]|uniref:G-patch domain-containing protein n=1 Tax=Punica granatum TaxID=22663 RepID=A0A2I0L893_PUNGR|nr:hypothetical protein CRG98_002711 [Punica granatum]
MARSVSFPHLDRVTPPLEEISHIWAYLDQVDRDYIRTFVRDIPMLAICRVDWNFLGAAMTFWDPVHAVFSIQGTELTPTIEEYRTLVGRIAATRGIVEPNFHTTRLVLVSRLFGVHSHIDAVLASVVLQVVGGREYEVALLAETIQSLDRVTRKTDRRLRGSPILLQIWLQSHANPFGLVRPGFKWRATWMPPRPMTLKCLDFNEVPLVSRTGSTTYFSARVVKQLGGLQTVPKGTTRTKFEHTWREDQTFIDRLSEIERVMTAWQTTIIEHPYFPEHPSTRYHNLEGDIAAAPASTIIPAPAPHPTRVPAIHPVDFYHPQSTIPATVSLLPMTISVPDLLHNLTSAPYQAPPPINITFFEPGPPTHAAPIAPPTNFLPGTETEQERRMKKMKETIRALQANDPRHSTSYLDLTLFLGMQLPKKVKVPDFQKYDETKDPRHHLRYYHKKMLQYWDYEQFAIATFQESLSGPALKWFISLRAEDIPSCAELSKKFVEQYQYNMETPPSFLEMSTMKMAEGQKFEDYATNWRSEAAKHFPPICEAQQIQMLHGTLKGAYYSHLMGHKSTFSEMIMAGKQVDLGIKLGSLNTSLNQFTIQPRWPRNKLSTTTPLLRPHSIGPRLRGLLSRHIPGPKFILANQDQSLHCEYRSGAPGHTTDNCWKLWEEIQKLIDAKKISFNTITPPNVQANHLPDHGSSSGPTINMISVYTMREDESQQEDPTPFVIDKVPWTYEGSVGNLEQQFSVMGMTRSGQVYENSETTGKGKVLVASGSLAYPVEEAHISLLALLLSSEPHREALLRVLTEAQVPKETTPDRNEEIVSSIFSNTISFSDDELPSEGWAHSRALHIVCKCNNFVIGLVMIDNGSALNVCPVSTLKQMNVDLNRIRPSKTAVRAFDDSRREVNGEIDLLIDVGPCSFSVLFQVLDIPNTFSLLLGRPWIHSTGAVPSSLHQRLKFIARERLITVKGKEDYAIYKETAVPYISIGDDENLPFHSLKTISIIWDYGEVRSSRADRMVGKVLLRHNYVPGTGLGAQGQGINCPIKIEEYKNRRGLGFRPSCHEISEARRGKHLYRLAAHYGKINRGILVLPLSHFFPALLDIVGGTLEEPSSVSDAEPVDLSAICTVTEETPLGVHIRLAQENEELNNWTSVPRYSAPRPIYFGEGLDEDGRVPKIEESLRRLKDRQLTSVEPTEEINVGTEEESRTLKIGTSLDPIQWARMIDFLKEYQEEEVIKQINAGFLEVYNYSEWVANIMPVEKKDGRVRVSVDYQDLNKASPKDNFPLPHIDVLVDNTARHTLFSFRDGFSGYNHIRMAEEDKIKTMFITMLGTFCYRVMPFGLKNAGATYQKAMVTLFHDMMHKEIEIYVDDMIAKSKEGEDYLVNLKRLFDRLKKYKLRLNPAKCTFDAKSRKLLGFVVHERCIELTRIRLKQSRSYLRHQRSVKYELTEYDIEYVPRTSVKGQAIADHLAEFPIEDDTPINSDFSDEGILQVDSEENKFAWKMYFDRAVNSTGSGIATVLISPDEHYYPIAAKIDFPCTNNVAEYEACILGLQAAIDFKVKELEVFGDSMLTIFQTLGQ